jgi:hypothetical protein
MLTPMQEKKIEGIGPQESNDAKFIAYCMSVVFGAKNLINASITGANRTSTTNKQLNPEKLKFIEGKNIW